MYAVIQLGTSQFKVSEGDIIEADLMKNESNTEINIEKVLMFVKGADIRIGQPFVEGVEVTAKVVKHSLGPKTVNFHYRRRKDSARKSGHRKKLTELNIVKIKA